MTQRSKRRHTRNTWMGSLLAAAILLLPHTAAAITEAQLLDELQHRAFLFFWNEANPANGLIRDRSTVWSPASIASTGFGLSAICIGIDHGWVTREDGRARVLTTLNTFWNGPQGSGVAGIIGYQGFFYHFLDMNTGFRTWDSELSTIDTALLEAGIMDCRMYFDTEDPLDIEVRTLADNITNRVNWEFARNFTNGIYMGWKPGTGFSGFGHWVGYNEATILYILALGSPTHGVPETTYNTWTNGYDWLTYYGTTYVNFPPLFGHQYSHCWIDFRSIQDAYMRTKGITYFENSRRATYAQRSYCIANPFARTGYGANQWGLTACDDPTGYRAHGAPPAQTDDGTIAPTAPAGSIAFAPEIAIPVLMNFYDSYQTQLWSTYGFKDAFNLGALWWDTDYLGIDQGPVILMIENYLRDGVWGRFMQHPDILLGLQRAGFLAATDVVDTPRFSGLALGQSMPNPMRQGATIQYELPADAPVRLLVTDVNGREVARLQEGFQRAGTHRAYLPADGLSNGVYFYRLEANGQALERQCVIVR